MQPGKNEEARKVFGEPVVPVAKEQKGFRAIYMLEEITLVVYFWERR